MEIQSTSGRTTLPTAPSSGASGISSDFNTFLQMLSVQMQNQDPLNPIESSDFAVQLATFSFVEQQVLTNDLLSALGEQLTLGNVAEMATWVGKEVRSMMPAYFDGAPVTLVPNPSALADSVEVVVRNESGQIVDTRPIPVSASPLDWAGVDSTGNALPKGAYSFEVVSYANGAVIMQEPAEVYGRVQEVRNDNGDLVLVMEGSIVVPAKSVTAIRGDG
ncbi:MAG: flagellar hook capping FlgD N-terminal domain-containing protein [Flavimaricola sp.]|nr:flagellar hook capping FlgD N-terminal domain-containing protein [Flavimaricola sp.]